MHSEKTRDLSRILDIKSFSYLSDNWENFITYRKYFSRQLSFLEVSEGYLFRCMKNPIFHESMVNVL